jgi:hypothetical protein
VLSDKVPYFIIDLLQQVPFVYVQGLGRFEAIFHPALVDLPQSQIKPPYIEPDFSLNGESSDEILAAFMHYVSGIDKPEAEDAIRAFVERIKSNTEDGKTYPVEKFGTFSTSAAGNLRFTPDWDAFNLSFSGLEVLDVKPQIQVERPVSDFIPVPAPKPIFTETVETPVVPLAEIKIETDLVTEELPAIDIEKTVRNQDEIDEHTSRLWWMILTIALILIAVLCAYLAWDIISNRNKLNEFKQIYPGGTTGTSLDDRPYTPDTIPLPVENIPIKEPEVKDPNISGGAQEEIVNPCFVVVGAFSDAGNVTKMVDRLKAMGYISEEIKGGALTKVAIKTSCDSLQKVLNDARSSINPEAWIY